MKMISSIRNKRKRNDDKAQNYEDSSDESEDKRDDAPKKLSKLHPPTRTSEVWKYFTTMSSNTARCNLCDKNYKLSRGTWNLIQHLRYKHSNVEYFLKKQQSSVESPSQWKNEKPDNGTECCEVETITVKLGEEEHFLGKDDSVDSAISSGSLPTYPQLHSSTPSSRCSSTQPTNEDFNDVQENFLAGPTDDKITQSILYMICVDNMSLDATEKEGMRHLLSVLCPSYTPPSEKTIIQLIEKEYSWMQAILKERLKLIKQFAISTHIVTVVDSNRSFLVVTLYYIDEKISSVRSICLGVVSYVAKHHISADMCHGLEQMFRTWEIPKKKIVSVITDSSGDNLQAFRLVFFYSGFKDRHVPCFATILSSVVTEALDRIKNLVGIIDKVEAIVSYFELNGIARAKLRKEQIKCGKSEGTILYLNGMEKSETKWRTSLYRLQRFLLVSDCVKNIFMAEHIKEPAMLTSTEIDIIKETVRLLEPFEQVAKETYREHTSGSLIIPLINCLDTRLQRIEVDYALAIDLHNELITQIEEKLHPLEENIFLAAATTLDPRFKQIHFSSPEFALKVINVLSNEMKNVLGAQTSAQDCSNLLVEKDDIWTIHDECAGESDNMIRGLPDELQQYLKLPLLPRKQDPIKYWVDNMKVMPAIYEIAIKYLTVLGSSVPSERVVATLNERIQLSSFQIDQLVFLNSMDDEYWEL